MKYKIILYGIALLCTVLIVYFAGRILDDSQATALQTIMGRGLAAMLTWIPLMIGMGMRGAPFGSDQSLSMCLENARSDAHFSWLMVKTMFSYVRVTTSIITVIGIALTNKYLEDWRAFLSVLAICYPIVCLFMGWFLRCYILPEDYYYE